MRTRATIINWSVVVVLHAIVYSYNTRTQARPQTCTTLHYMETDMPTAAAEQSTGQNTNPVDLLCFVCV